MQLSPHTHHTLRPRKGKIPAFCQRSPEQERRVGRPLLLLFGKLLAFLESCGGKGMERKLKSQAPDEMRRTAGKRSFLCVHAHHTELAFLPPGLSSRFEWEIRIPRRNLELKKEPALKVNAFSFPHFLSSLYVSSSLILRAEGKERGAVLYRFFFLAARSRSSFYTFAMCMHRLPGIGTRTSSDRTRLRKKPVLENASYCTASIFGKDVEQHKQTLFNPNSAYYLVSDNRSPRRAHP